MPRPQLTMTQRTFFISDADLIVSERFSEEPGRRQPCSFRALTPRKTDLE
jgi:hypothetical protein